MFNRLPKAKEKYVSLDRAADGLRLEQSQLNQFLVTGQLLASIVYHKPSDYREQRVAIIAAVISGLVIMRFKGEL